MTTVLVSVFLLAVAACGGGSQGIVLPTPESQEQLAKVAEEPSPTMTSTSTAIPSAAPAPTIQSTNTSISDMLLGKSPQDCGENCGVWGFLGRYFIMFLGCVRLIRE